MKYNVADAGERTASEIFALPEEKIFQLISLSLSETSDEIFEYLPSGFLPGRFDIRVPVDIFNDWEIYLVEDAFGAKIIYAKDGSSRVNSATILRSEFDSIVRVVHNKIEEILQQYN